MLFFFLFLSIANKVKIEKLYCVKKKRKKEYNKVSAYACFIKKNQTKGNRTSENFGCGGLF